MVSRPALADWLQIYKAPGENETPVNPVKNGLDRNIWIEWADMVWQSDEKQLCLPSSIWFDINETRVLNNRASVDEVIGAHHKPPNTKFEGDEKHMCPLQLDLIERCILLWSNPGETVFTPFAGIGSEMIGALMHDRKALGIELNPAYVDEAIRNCEGILSKKREESKILTFDF